MTTEHLILIGRESHDAQEVYETHADRLADRGVVDQVTVETYEHEPRYELRDRLTGIDAERVYAVPMRATHGSDTAEEIPAALSAVPGEVSYCDLVGRSPAVTDALLDRARSHVAATEERQASLILIGSGSGRSPDGYRTMECQADLLRDGTEYEEVVTAYLTRDPAVECVRYNLSEPRAVAVPMFLTANRATETQIPDRLCPDRSGIECASPLGTHARVTDAIEAEVEKQRVLNAGGESKQTLAENGRPLAANGKLW